MEKFKALELSGIVLGEFLGMIMKLKIFSFQIKQFYFRKKNGRKNDKRYRKIGTYGPGSIDNQKIIRFSRMRPVIIDKNPQKAKNN